MEDLRASNHYRRAGDLYLRRRTCVGWGRGATHWVDRVGICGRLVFGLIIYTLEFWWYNFESKNRDMPSISCFKFIVTIRNIFQQWKVKYKIKNCIFWQRPPKWPLWCHKKTNYLSRMAAKIRLEMAIDVLAVGKLARRDGVAILSPCPSQ